MKDSIIKDMMSLVRLKNETNRKKKQMQYKQQKRKNRNR